MPGLLTLRTDLKSLKYGQDRPGGGDSGQPYITVDINTNTYNEGLPQLIKAGDDGYIRGGTIGAFRSSEIDRRRIEKFLYDGVQGTLFITKQVGLHISNPRLEVPKNPRNIIQGIPENALAFGTNGFLEPTRIYNGGVNTLAQIPVNAFGRHFNKHGLLVEQSEASKYEAVATANNESTIFNQNGNNRLLSLKNKFELGDNLSNAADPTQQLINRINRIITGVTNVFNTISAPLGGPRIPKFSLTPEQQIIDQYIGGPSSVYGVGQTVIKRYNNTEDGEKISQAIERSRQRSGRSLDKNGQDIDLNYYNTLGVSKQYFNNNNDIDINNGIDSAYPNYKPGNLDTTTYSNQRTEPLIGTITVNNIVNFEDLGPEIKKVPIRNASYSAYKKIIDSQQLTEYTYNISGSLANAFGIYNSGSITSNIIFFNPNSLDYPAYYNSQTRKAIIIKKPWNEVYREKRIGSGLQDSINLTPIFSSTSYNNFNKVTLSNGKEYTVRDLAKFIIQSVDTDNNYTTNPLGSSTFMIFRAYLTQFSDNVDAQWSDVKYAGRGNPFYIYNGFTRKIQIGFKVAALSAEEMAPMYSKLNYLMSSLMPDYGDKNVMRGPLHRMTVGNYLDAQLGILNSISYTVPNDSPWEIAIDEPEGGTRQLILPHILEVQMSFTPIGAETGWFNAEGNGVVNNKIEEKSEYISLLAQNTTGGDVATTQYYDAFINPDSILTVEKSS